MYQEVISGIVCGVTGQLIHVEVEIRNGLPYFSMVGYLSRESMEAKERVASALRSIGHPLPSMKITVNLSPANIRKSGTAFDFPIAAAFLGCLGLIPADRLRKICILGELGLNGRIRGVKNCLPIILKAQEYGIDQFFVAEEDRNSLESMEGIEVIFMNRLQDVLDYFHGSYHGKQEPSGQEFQWEAEEGDFADLKGMEHLKRAIEIAVIGRHHLLIAGAPGSGKSMAVRRIPTILPQLSKNERLEVQSIYDAAEISRNLLDPRPPFRAPHSTIPRAAFLGGGKIPKAGEITLAHHGILFMDEFMEYRTECIEGLRLPLEEKKLEISRMGLHMIFPSDFLLIAAMNPCPCGYALEDGQCRCSYHEKKRYLKKLSGPLLDRFDLIIGTIGVGEDGESLDFHKKICEDGLGTSDQIRSRIQRYTEEERYILSGSSWKYFSEIPSQHMESYCPMENECINLLNTAYDMGKITRRGADKIRRVAMTIAVMDGKKIIAPVHLMEAMTFRNSNFIKEVLEYGG